MEDERVSSKGTYLLLPGVHLMSLHVEGLLSVLLGQLVLFLPLLVLLKKPFVLATWCKIRCEVYERMKVMDLEVWCDEAKMIYRQT